METVETHPDSVAAGSQAAIDDCTICLAPISERAVAAPCNHCCFDFKCLVQWTKEQPTCPICKTENPPS
jgi:hypothetical protein